MSQVMRRPRRQQLRESHNSESRMPPPPLKVLSPQIQRTQFAHVLLPQTSKFIQQLLQRLAPTLSHMPQTIKRLERPTLTRFQYHPRARQPINAFAIDQMPYDIEYAPGVFPFTSHRPRLR